MKRQKFLLLVSALFLLQFLTCTSKNMETRHRKNGEHMTERFGSCLRFKCSTTSEFSEGSNRDYVLLNEKAELDYESFTFEAWVKLDNASTGAGTLIAGNTDVTNTKTLKVRLLYTGNIEVDFMYSKYELNAKLQRSLEYPTHLAITFEVVAYNTGVLSIFLNGTSGEMKIMDLSGNFDNPLKPGYWSLGSGYGSFSLGNGETTLWTNCYNGWVDEVRIWNFAKTIFEVRSDMFNPLRGEGNKTKNWAKIGTDASINPSVNASHNMWDNSGIFDSVYFDAKPTTPYALRSFLMKTSVNDNQYQNSSNYQSYMIPISTNELLIFEGGSTWIYSTDEFKYSRIATKTLNIQHGASIISVHGYIYIYGGSNDADNITPTNNLYKFDMKTGNWAPIDQTGDERAFHFSTNVKKEMVVFYGMKNNSFVYDSIKAFSTVTNKWRNVTTSGDMPRNEKNACIPSLGRNSNKIYRYQVESCISDLASNRIGYMSTLDLDTWTWKQLEMKGYSTWADRSFMTSVGPFIIHFGGLCNGTVLKEPASFDTGTNTWKSLTDKNMIGSILSGISQGTRAFVRKDWGAMWLIDVSNCTMKTQIRGLCRDDLQICAKNYYGDQCQFIDCEDKCKLTSKECNVNTGECISQDESSGKNSSSILSVAAIASIAIVSTLTLIVVITLYMKSEWIKGKFSEKENELVHRIDPLEVEVKYLIGKGGFGEVYFGLWKGTEVAVKKLNKQNLDEGVIGSFEEELKIIVQLRHPNIVLYMGVFYEGSHMGILTEFMEKGSLYDSSEGNNSTLTSIPYDIIIKKVLRNSEYELNIGSKVGFLLDTARGMLFLHSANPPILHRDLKSPNLLLDRRWNVKISDFGLTIMDGSDKHESTPAGSLLWMAPEIIEGKKYTEASDVYSFAIVCWEVFTREEPYKDENPLSVSFQVTTIQRRPVFPEEVEIPNSLKELIKLSWDQKISVRPSFREIVDTLSHFVQEFHSEASYVTIESSKNKKSTTASISSLENIISAPSGNVVFVSAHIEGYVDMWESTPKDMADAMTLYTSLMKKIVHMYYGYEVRNEDGFYLLAFSSWMHAIQFCLATQDTILSLNWPKALLENDHARLMEIDGLLTFKGFRIQMSVDIGEPTMDVNMTSKRTNYFGPVITRVNYLGYVAKGGQILLSDLIYQELVNEVHKLHDLSIRCLAELSMGNLFQNESIYEILPKKLKHRISLFGTDIISTAVAEPPNTVQLPFECCTNGFRWEMDISEVQISSTVIGESSNSVVFLGDYKGTPVSVKRFSKMVKGESAFFQLLYKVILMSNINHPNIVRLVGAHMKPGMEIMVTEYAPLGNLTRFLGNQKELLSGNDRISIAKQIIEGLCYLHSLTSPILHGDINSAKVLVMSDTPLRVCLGDFVMARMKQKNHTISKFDTRAWLAPEVLRGQKYSDKADIFSYGILVWEIVMGVVPYEGHNPFKVIAGIMEGERLPILQREPAFLIYLIQMCWDTQPENRPNAQQIVSDFIIEAKTR